MDGKTAENHHHLTRGDRAKIESGSLSYVRAISTQLAQIARTDGFETLASLLDMAALEAASAAKKKKGTPIKATRIVPSTSAQDESASNENTSRP